MRRNHGTVAILFTPARRDHHSSPVLFQFGTCGFTDFAGMGWLEEPIRHGRMRMKGSAVNSQFGRCWHSSLMPSYQTDATAGQTKDGPPNNLAFGHVTQVDGGGRGRTIPGQAESPIAIAGAQPLDQHRPVAAADAGYVTGLRPAEPAVAFQQDVVSVFERGHHAAAAYADDAPAQPASVTWVRGRDRRPRYSADRGRACARS